MSAAFLQLGHRLEYDWVGERTAGVPDIVLLHHGLGSLGGWRDFPEQLARATGRAVLAYSRLGYGASEPVTEIPRPVDFMHREALGDLPALLNAFDVRAPVLVGHSDGASIAVIYAASRITPLPSGLVLLAPHVFVEQRTIDSALAARNAYENGDLRARLARHHADPDGAFLGWNATWLQPGFREWNIEEVADRVVCRVTVVQGTDDEYGTGAQVDRIVDGRSGREAVMLEHCGHAPHKDQPKATLEAIRRHVSRVT